MQLAPEIQKDIENLLDEIWSVFKRAGTTDQREIVASLATLLTSGKAEAFNEELQPQKPRNRYNVDDELIPLLKRASTKIDMGTFFDRYILFYSQFKEGGNAYPIPRHIIDFLVKLLQVEPADSFADFTCGTGGFLVNQYRKENLRQGETVGIEISPDMIRLAVANALLHDMPVEHTHFYPGNALRICSTDVELKDRSFDRIAMAPPFGITIEDELASIWADESNSRTSEDLFTRLALKKLKRSGWAVLIVPLGLTYRETRGMPQLRNTLLQDYTTHAVISLPENALAPFTSSPVCILLMRNEPPPETHQVWFFQAQKDGYPTGLNRNLLTEPKLMPASNDLPLAEQTILLPDTALHPIPTASPQMSVGISFAYITLENNSISRERQLYGVIIKVGESTILRLIRLLSFIQADIQQTHLLIEASGDGMEMAYIVLPLPTEAPSTNSSRAFMQRSEAYEYLRQLSGQKKIEDVPKEMTIFSDGLPGQKLIIAQDGRILGITQPRSRIEAPNHWLQPEHYIPLPDVTFSTDSPVKLFDKVQKDQRLIARYVDSLLGQLEVRPIINQELPPLLYSNLHTSLIESLGPEQKAIWEFIEQQTLTESQADEGKDYALYFVPDQLYNEYGISDKSKLHVQQTLDLLVRMGLLVSVLVKLPDKNAPIACYRRVTRLDIATFPERLDV